MDLFPAIDLYDGRAVRLLRGDYAQMTVYSEDPVSVAQAFEQCGARHLHTVDLQGARDGGTPNFDIVKAFTEQTSLSVEVGGGIRSMEVIGRYLDIGVSRVILGTAAIEDENLLQSALQKYGDRIAVGADIRDGYVSVKGWTEQSSVTCDAFFARMQKLGVATVICTDISRDGAMRGTNLALYRSLREKYTVAIIASGGVSTLADIVALRDMKVDGAIIGKAYYTGAMDLRRAIEVAK